MALAPVTTTSGTRIVDQSVIPYIRSKEVEFTSHSLRPTRDAYFFFDETDVTRFTQKANKLVLTTDTALNFKIGEGVYCNTTGAFGRVIGVTPNTTLWMNENFVCIKIAAFGANTLTAASYSKGDIVFQATGTTTDSVTFQGTVEYWQVADGVLVVVPEKGTVNTSLKTLGVQNKAILSNAQSLVYGARFPALGAISSTSNVGLTATISSYTNRSGIPALAAANANTIYLASNNGITTLPGNTFYVTSGAGIGEFSLIVSANATANSITLQNNLSKILTGNSRYSIGSHKTDEAGYLNGIFNIPELPAVKFLTGERIFSIQDSSTFGDSDMTMSSMARYVSQGFLNLVETFQTPTVQQTAPLRPAPVVQQPTRQERRRRDPIAQTFYTPDPKSNKANYGIFVSSIDLWFKTKPASNAPKLPVEVRIVETQNGYPTQKILATAVVPWAQVKTSTIPDGSISTTNPTKTKFTFADPVYLEPSTEYAIVVYSESRDYEVWISELGQTNIARTNGGVISEQPYAGSFFRSQNASTWTPYQNQDLMFVINKCLFSQTPSTLTFRVKAKDYPILVDEMRLHSSHISFPSTSINYRVDSTIKSSGTKDGGNFISVDKKFDFARDLKVSSKFSNRRRIVQAGNNESMLVKVYMSTSDPDVSPMFNKERVSAFLFSNYINGGGIRKGDITITSGGSHSNAANISVSFSSPDLVTGSAPTANVVSLSGGKVTAINIINEGSGYTRAPTITISEPAASSNATAVVAGEDKYFGGNSLMRYVTRKITLADGFDAGDLRVFVQGIRPIGTHIQAYYKVLGSSDSADFSERTWVPMELENSATYSPDQLTIIELKFVPKINSVTGEPTGRLEYVLGDTSYPVGVTFKSFAIKLVCFADDPTVNPIITSMRAIALPGDPSYPTG